MVRIKANAELKKDYQLRDENPDTSIFQRGHRSQLMERLKVKVIMQQSLNCSRKDEKRESQYCPTTMSTLTKRMGLWKVPEKLKDWLSKRL